MLSIFEIAISLRGSRTILILGRENRSRVRVSVVLTIRDSFDCIDGPRYRPRQGPLQHDRWGSFIIFPLYTCNGMNSIPS